MPRPPSRVDPDRLLQADAALSARLAVPAGPLRLLAFVFAHSGDSPLWLAAAAAALLWGGAPWRPFGLRALAATLAGGAAATLLKLLFRRTRPGGPSVGLYTRLDRHAFPSGPEKIDSNTFKSSAKWIFPFGLVSSVLFRASGLSKSAL